MGHPNSCLRSDILAVEMYPTQALLEWAINRCFGLAGQGSTKVAGRPAVFQEFPAQTRYTSRHPLIGSFCTIWGFTLSLLLGVVGLLYAVLFLGFWSLGRMSALTDRFVESRANVIPFHRG